MFVAKLEVDGSKLLCSLYLGGSAGDYGNSITMDSVDNVFVTGYTLSYNFSTVNPLQAIIGGYRDAFVVKIGAPVIYLPLILR